MLTPIYLKLEDYYKSNHSEVPSEEGITLSDPFYYLMITPPRESNRFSQMPTSPFKVVLPGQGSLTNKIRIQLAPSIGLAINSSYKTEFWEWRKPIIPESIKMEIPPKVSKKLVATEHWTVPTPEKIYFKYLEELINYTPSIASLDYLKVTRSSSHGDNLNEHPYIIDIKKITSLNKEVEYHNFKLQELSGNLVLDWSGSAEPPAEEEEYLIEYVRPIGYEDLLLSDLHKPHLCRS